jgi:hypothetical protein
MALEHHVFISYSHIDNQPLPTEKEGWVTLFHEALKQLLSVRLGRNANIWRDQKLNGNDVFSEEIIDQFPKTAALVSILTPRYLKSEWCTKEISEFCEVAEHTGGLAVGNKCRVFKVVKLPADKQDPLPPVFTQVLGYEFYDLDEDQAPRELDPAYGEKSKQDFLRKLAKLAWDIKLLLDQLGDTAPSLEDLKKTGAASKPVIYLAECSYDLREAREILEGELKRLGYNVVPGKELPGDEEKYRTEVEKLLVQSRLSIHLVGDSYGLVPDGPSQKSAVVLQNELAVKRCRSGRLQRVIWIPQGITPKHPAQAEFMQLLNHDAEAQFGAELITGDLETLKSAVHAALKKISEADRVGPASAMTSARNSKSIHVLCDAKDRKDIIALLKFLKGRGLDVSLPIFTGDAGIVREANQELLLSCDGVILYYGAGDEAWRFHQQNELKKIRARQTGKPFPDEFIFLAGPNTDDKALMLDLQEPNLINGLNGFSEGAMAAFINTVAPEAATS